MVSTHLKNISQNGNLPQIGVKIKKYLKPPPSLVAFFEKLPIWNIYASENGEYVFQHWWGKHKKVWYPHQEVCNLLLHSMLVGYIPQSLLVGGWTNPLETYARQISSNWIISPRIGPHIKNVWVATPQSLTVHVWPRHRLPGIHGFQGLTRCMDSRNLDVPKVVGKKKKIFLPNGGKFNDDLLW